MNEEVIKNRILKENNINKKYEILYDYLYDYLVKQWHDNNYCDFKDNKCIANRAKKTIHEDNGCCWKKGYGLCSYLNEDKICSCNSISCKLFVCSYLRKKVRFNPKGLPLVKEFLTNKQQKILTKNLLRPKDDILQQLIKYDKTM